MTKEKALNILEKMTDRKFTTFLDNLPLRTQMLVKARFVDWREVLPQWYIELNKQLTK